MTTPAIKLGIASRLHDVFLVGAAVNQIARACGCDGGCAFEAEAAVVEAVNNSNEHSYQKRCPTRTRWPLWQPDFFRSG
jgi:anti-sigma regulatory factor (Ser/Thr protein kinase)